jgi:hypothetical protein
MGTRKSALAGFGMLGALALGACSTEATAPTSDPAPTAAPATVGATAPEASALLRISNAQYDNAVRDLLGVDNLPDSTFPVDTAQGDHFAQYFDAADTLGEQVFANPFLKARLLTCTPSEADTACTRQIVASLGSRAWRGPMSNEDVDRLTKVATDAVALGETPSDSIKQVVKTVLASPQFLYTVAPAATL